ncbi:MAG: PilZ domain-containing protein [Deltaproteobacteria bacterium]|nr:PilZ domain-containing protein [Deltaproteobacteria bacterium]
MDKKTESRRQFPRVGIKAQVEFFVDADIVTAETIDISDGGLRITTQVPVKATLRLTEKNGRISEYQAEMIWARRNPDEQMTFGLKFIDGGDKVLDIVSF